MSAAVAILLGTILVAPGVAQADAPDRAGAPRIDGGSVGADQGYLALGDSISSGFQGGVARYDDGYVRIVADALQTKGVTVRKNLSCPGETTTTMIKGGASSINGGIACTQFTGATSQLAAAVDYLATHDVKVITLSIGGNDLTGCVDQDMAVDTGCITTGLGTVGKNLTYILARLRLAEPNATIVVLNYYDPYLAYWLTGSKGKALAVASVPLIGSLNGVIAASSVATLSKVANVAGAFKTTAWTPLVKVALGSKTVWAPTNVAMICRHTWMCQKNDNHPQDTGYALIADAVLAKLGG